MTFWKTQNCGDKKHQGCQGPGLGVTVCRGWEETELLCILLVAVAARL